MDTDVRIIKRKIMGAASSLVEEANGKVHIQSILQEMKKRSMDMSYLQDLEDEIKELGCSIFTD